MRIRLEHYTDLLKEIEELDMMILDLEAKAQAQSPQLTGMPAGSGPGDRVGTYGALLADARDKLERVKLRSLIALNDIAETLETVEDPTMRRVVALKFIKGMSWREVAFKAGFPSEDACRMAFNRFFRKKS